MKPYRTKQDHNADKRMRANGDDPLLIRYEIYVDCANDGKGGDITRDGAPLLTFDEWKAA